MANPRNVGVFIDAENLFKGYGKLEIPDIAMADLLEQIERRASAEAGAGDILVSRAYADWNAIGLEDYRRDVERAGVETVQVFSVGKASKNAADIVLVVDTLRCADDLDQLEVIVIVSGDGDFVPLVRRLHELGKYVVGATLADSGLNSVLEQEVDLYVALRLGPEPSLAPVFSVGTAPAAPARPVRQQPAKKQQDPPKQDVKKQTPTKKDEPKQAPAKKAAASASTRSGKPNWHELSRAIEVVHQGPAGSPEEFKEIVKQLLNTPSVRSYVDQLANHGGTLPQLAMAIKAAAPALSPSDARVSNLSRALRFALAGTQYALARPTPDVQPVIVRRGAGAEGVLPDLSLDDIRTGAQ